MVDTQIALVMLVMNLAQAEESSYQMMRQIMIGIQASEKITWVKTAPGSFHSFHILKNRDSILIIRQLR